MFLGLANCYLTETVVSEGTEVGVLSLFKLSRPKLIEINVQQ